jgi:hypothetical protein
MAAVVQTNSTLLTNLYGSSPALLNSDFLDKNSVRYSEGTVAVTTNDSITSQYRFCQIDSGDSIKSILVGFDALGGSSTIKLGLYETNSTTVAESVAGNAALFVASVSTVTAAAPTEQRFNALAGNTIGQRVWELLGLSADPRKKYDLCATLTAVAAANGKISFRYVFNR